mgnify:FL=1|jgi:hypothetical protein
MKTHLSVLAAFAVGIGVGAIATGALGPVAAESAGISVSDIDGLDDRIRAIAEECVITGAGTSLARLTCRRDAF